MEITGGIFLTAIFAALILGASIMLLVCQAYGTSVLEMESNPVTNGTGLTLSDDALDTDIQINIDKLEEDTLEGNKTRIMSTEGATDIDMDELPPPGVTVLIRNNQVMVTTNPVTVTMWDLEPDIRDEIIDVAKEHNQTGEIIIGLPKDYPNTSTSIVASNVPDQDEDEDDG